MSGLFLLLWAWVAVAAPAPSALHISGRGATRTEGLNCEKDPCGEVLPGAVRFEKTEGKPYVVGYNEGGEVVGWVVMSTDVVDIIGYSGKPLFTLIGLSPDGTIAGAKVVYHSEPILLLGIPEQKLTDFVNKHVGSRADRKIVVGGTAGEGELSIDIVSGATVTVLAESQTLMESARAVGMDVGVVEPPPKVPGHFVEAEPWTWDQIVANGALGHLQVHQSEMDLPPDPQGRLFGDLWFGVVDAPQVGIPLLGEGTYRWAMKNLEPGEHLFVVFNAGSYSFKGSGFVRGGIFDRFRLEQGLHAVFFSDLDYQKLGTPKDIGAPDLWEGGLFVTRDDVLDPGLTYSLVLLGSSYATERGAFERDFQSFAGVHRTPPSVYVLDGPDPEAKPEVWREAWRLGWKKAVFVGLYLFVISLIFVFRKATTAKMQRLKSLHIGVQTVSFVLLGLYLHVQPSVTQLLTIAGNMKDGWDWTFFLTDPVLFVSWIFIFIMIFIWGRGVFCGWACPYGAFNEITFKIARKLKIPEYELPDSIHNKARYIRYFVFAFLLIAFLYDAEIGERLAEVEPFKSTFFVSLWTRHPALIAWWFTLFVWSIFTYRPFCRYVCPLGAAIAAPSTFRASGPYRRNFCSKCKICAKGCEPRAIRPDGTIDSRECLNCWECEANYESDQVCPPLVGARRKRERAARKQ